MLAAPNAHGIYHQPLPGPGFQQGWSVEPVHGQPTWVEGSVGEQAVYYIDDMVRPQEESATTFFELPREIEPDHKMFLQATVADFARGAVQTIQCRVCPEARFRDFGEFKRHCKTSETHPLSIHFCDRCGVYFARSDSCTWHHRQRLKECLKVTLEEAAMKRQRTEDEHGKFVQRLRHNLKTGGNIGLTFTQTMKRIYPDSVKKGTAGEE